jgi:hypothetical protein
MLTKLQFVEEPKSRHLAEEGGFFFARLPQNEPIKSEVSSKKSL